jgi:hypothetical protein
MSFYICLEIGNGFPSVSRFKEKKRSYLSPFAPILSALQTATHYTSSALLAPTQVRRLREKCAAYLAGSGRICVGALPQKLIDPVNDAIAQVTN